MYTDSLEEIKKYCDEIICFYTDNDPYVPLEFEEDFAKKIATKSILIPNGGHLNSEFGYEEALFLLPYL